MKTTAPKLKSQLFICVRTDRPSAQIYIFDNLNQMAELEWMADRKLAETIHEKIKETLNKLSISLNDIGGIVCYKGPGSFTGLRIGISVANTLAYSLNIPIVARSGNDWCSQGINSLISGENDEVATPFYSSPAKTTSPKK